MAYNSQELFEKAKKLIKERNLFFHTDVFEQLVISSSTYYEHFPKESSEYKAIDEMLSENRSKIKNGLRSKWFHSEAAATSIALYKLIATADERKKLSQQYSDVTSGGDKLAPTALVRFAEPPRDDSTDDDSTD